MLILGLFASLLSFTSAGTEVYFLPSGAPFMQSRENFIPYSSPIHIHAPTAGPLPIPVRVSVPEDHQLKAKTVEEAAIDAESLIGQKEWVAIGEGKGQGVSNEHKTLTPASTFLSHDAKSLAPRQIVFVNGFPIPYAHPQRKRVVRQVLGSSVWDQKVIDWGSKNCQPLPLIGGAVAGASGGPVGVILGVIGAGIGACNFNN